MASQVQINVYAIDGIPQTQGSFQMYLPTKEVFIQEYEAQENINVHSLVTHYPNPNSRSKTQEFQVWQTVPTLETDANTNGNSMFAADVYAINLSFFKNGGRPMLFPNDKPSIWPYENGDIHSLVTFKGNDYYANETKTVLAASANEGGGGGSSYLVYTPIISQASALVNPIVTALQNTLGGTVIWTREDVGIYFATLANAFPENKTYIPPFEAGGTVMIPISKINIADYYYSFYWGDENTVYLKVFDNNYAAADLFTAISGARLSLPEIRVYP